MTFVSQLMVRLSARSGLKKDGSSSKEETNKATWWLSRLIRRSKNVNVEWPFPFTEEKLFVLTLSAGLEGYHVSVDGKHVTSFPFRTVSNQYSVNCFLE